MKNKRQTDQQEENRQDCPGQHDNRGDAGRDPGPLQEQDLDHRAAAGAWRK